MSESGHAKNIEYFSEIISYVTAYGSAYEPSNAAIELSALNAALTLAQNSMTNVSTNLATYKITVNDREGAYTPLKKTATKMVNAIIASGATEKEIQDAKSINRKIQGTRHKKATPDDPGTPPPEGETHSTSQQSYSQLLEHFRNFIDLADSIPTYDPNEKELKIVDLRLYADSLGTDNLSVINSVTNISNARLSRNAAMYNDPDCLYQLVGWVKSYVKSVFGASSPQYKQIAKIPFRRVA